MSGNSIFSKTMALVVGLVVMTAADPALARQWKQTPAAQAMDYAEIVDRQEKDMAVLLWITAPAFPVLNKDGLLDKYVILGAVHGKFVAGADLTSVPVDTLEARDGSGNALKLVKAEDYPPMIAGMATMMKSMMGSSLGPIGKGLQVFVFKAGSVDACKPGKLVVPFIGQDYSWNTPIPGCQLP